MANGEGLKKYDSTILPAHFEKLSKDQQVRLINKMAENDVELRNRINEKIGDSKLAEHDMANILEMVQSVEVEGKFINVQQNIKTGSGNIKVDIKGGDRKLLIPFLVIGVIAVIIVLILVFE